MKRKPIIAYIIFGLIAIGFAAEFFSSPGRLLIPLLVFGIVFYLYKYPPGRRKGRTTVIPPRNRDGKERRKTSFRVIRGNKNDDDPPAYH